MSDAHLSILPAPQRTLWDHIQESYSVLDDLAFYLAGGTGLALQLGHRESVDFDFFTMQHDIREQTEQWLADFSSMIRDADADTVHASLDTVQCSFIGGYQYQTIEKCTSIGNIRIASIIDIALMKLLAMTHRAVVRDYIDMAVIIRDQYSLQEIISKSTQKYGDDFPVMLSVRVLTEFTDVDGDMPTLLDEDLQENWQRILQDAVSELIL